MTEWIPDNSYFAVARSNESYGTACPVTLETIWTPEAHFAAYYNFYLNSSRAEYLIYTGTILKIPEISCTYRSVSVRYF